MKTPHTIFWIALTCAFALACLFATAVPAPQAEQSARSDFYWQITAPCLPWPTCAYEPTQISFDHPTAGEPPHTEQTPPYVPPHTPDVPVPLAGSLAMLVLGAIILLSTRVGRSHSGDRDSRTA